LNWRDSRAEDNVRKRPFQKKSDPLPHSGLSGLLQNYKKILIHKTFSGKVAELFFHIQLPSYFSIQKQKRRKMGNYINLGNGDFQSIDEREIGSCSTVLRQSISFA
jgi:hypothetical protein